MTLLNTYGRAMLAILWFVLLTANAEAHYLPRAEKFDSSTQFDLTSSIVMPGITGKHHTAIAALHYRSTGHHPPISKLYQLPELAPALFSQYNLPRQTGCLAIGLYFEARGESFSGQIAVGQVILNRVSSRKYPGNICDVVYQNAHKKNRCQFSFACDGKIENPRNSKAWKKSMRLAKVLTGSSGTALFMKNFLLNIVLSQKLSRATHYHANYARPIWRKKLQRAGQVGHHIFYVSSRVWL